MQLQSKSRKYFSRFPSSLYPSGWFRVAFSNELPLGKVMPLHYFGKHLLLFRTEDGTAQVKDAYCLHRGIHSDSGRKTHIQMWSVCEIDGLIMVYYHPDKESPSWKFPGITGWTSQSWSAFTRRTWKVRTHIQDIGENNLHDIHFFSVHQPRFKSVSTKPVEINGPSFSRSLSTTVSLAEALNFETRAELEFIQHGMGCVVIHSTMNLGRKLKTLAVALSTPIDQNHIEVCLFVSSQKIFLGLVNIVLDRLGMNEVIDHFEREIQIFENKIYPKQMLLDEEDGPIGQYRDWAHQFYNS
ncbi:MAG: Rieske 2Fe-2S domain-containing protein [Cyanobacteria bacterium J06639_16]